MRTGSTRRWPMAAVLAAGTVGLMASPVASGQAVGSPAARAVMTATAMTTPVWLAASAQRAAQQRRLVVVLAEPAWNASGGGVTPGAARTLTAHAGVRAWLTANAVTVHQPGERRAAGLASGVNEPAVFSGSRRLSLPGVIPGPAADAEALVGGRKEGTGSGEAVASPTATWLRLRWLHAGTFGSGAAGASKQAGPAATAPGLDMTQRVIEARAAAERGDIAKAAGLYAWMWQMGPTLDGAMAAVRLGPLAEEMTTLAGAHAQARARFVTLRDDMERRIGELSPEEELAWLRLCQVTGDPGRVVATLRSLVDGTAQRTGGGQALAARSRLMLMTLDALGGASPAEAAWSSAVAAVRRESNAAGLVTLAETARAVTPAALTAAAPAGQSAGAQAARERAIRWFRTSDLPRRPDQGQ
ncbi:MAG: hypothetical protein IOD15_13485 [Phycisphaerales bacterium]|nr:hypothetical protein [Phycisphaerales bacterium]